MSGADINELVRQLLGVPDLKPERFADVLEVGISQTGGNRWWKFHDFVFPEGPFARGDLRLHVEGKRALLVLDCRVGQPVDEKDLTLSQWGPFTNISVNPQIPPEGTDSYVYQIGGVEVSFQFLHQSRRLRSVALKWGQ